jgi:hypothetical protein
MEICRLWKDHLKNDLRSDQDHRQKVDLRSRSRSRFFNDLKIKIKIIDRSIFAPKVPFWRLFFDISYKTFLTNLIFFPDV